VDPSKYPIFAILPGRVRTSKAGLWAEVPNGTCLVERMNVRRCTASYGIRDLGHVLPLLTFCTWPPFSFRSAPSLVSLPHVPFVGLWKQKRDIHLLSVVNNLNYVVSFLKLSVY
jgi:hypothetical protein